MLRQPDVSQTHIAFVYAGDIWVAPKTGGTANRLSSPAGEEAFPKFSPDGSQLAFTGNYDGNADIYRVATAGGQVERLTHHPAADQMLEWYADGQSLLFASAMQSERKRYRQFFRLPIDGGLPEKLPVALGEFASLSPDEEWLAFTMKSQESRTWKRYRGGTAADVWLINLTTLESKNVTSHPAHDGVPMWSERTVYFLSDRGPEQRRNLWAYDLDDEALRQVTRFEQFDVHYPSIGPDDIVFEAGGRLHLLNLADEQHHPVEIQVVTDGASLKPSNKNVSDLISSYAASPSGKRVLFEARGDIFSVPAEHGAVMNLTRSSGAAERYPAWSPDGESIAYWTDQSGEFELAIRSADRRNQETVATSYGPGYRYRPHWSPDGTKLAFIDQSMTIRIFDRETKSTTRVDQDQGKLHPGLSATRFDWSPDSRWLAYDRLLENENRAICLYDTEDNKSHQATSGYYDDSHPVFDPGGEYLFLLTSRRFAPSYSSLQPTWIYANSMQIAAVPLQKVGASPLAPRNDAEEDVEEDEEKKNESDDEKKEDEKEEGAEGRDDEVEPVQIDLEDFERRLVALPPEAGNYADLDAAAGKVLYLRFPRNDSADGKPALMLYDLEEREEKTILGDVMSYQLTANGKKIVVRSGAKYGDDEKNPEKKNDKQLAVDNLEATIDPRAEWKQIFSEAWRLNRDFFYDPALHGLDWDEMRSHYGALLDDAVTRWDVNFVIGELIGELNASHTYRGGGDQESAPTRPVGLLGVDWTRENDAYRIARIVRAAAWDNEVRSPLDEPGVDVDEGDYVLAVNGLPLDAGSDPWAAFQGLAGETVVLAVGDHPDLEKCRDVVVKMLTVRQESRLRELAWIEANRQRVEQATNGRVGYLYVPDTGVNGQTELFRQFAAQHGREGLIIDERFNSGGQLGDRFVELLDRHAYTYLFSRYGEDRHHPPRAHFGPQVMLINGWSGSGGDALPWFFRMAERGKIIGTRTWGGLVGPAVGHRLIDGGVVVVPPSRLYGPDGEWFAEGHGVEPDIHVAEDPTALARGVDPQLERAIQEIEAALAAQRQPTHPPTPAMEDRSGARSPKGEK
ncbi:MAG: PDZ domain-containing protein [Planctomycetota bacterium]